MRRIVLALMLLASFTSCENSWEQSSAQALEEGFLNPPPKPGHVSGGTG